MSTNKALSANDRFFLDMMQILEGVDYCFCDENIVELKDRRETFIADIRRIAENVDDAIHKKDVCLLGDSILSLKHEFEAYTCILDDILDELIEQQLDKAAVNFVIVET